MVGVKFEGRLGNQLFQLHFFLYLKYNNKGKVFFFTNPQDAYLTKYFDLGKQNNLLLGSKLITLGERVVSKLLKFSDSYILNTQVPKAVQVKNKTIYKGYFQTDWYINHTSQPVNVTIKKQYQDIFQQQFGEIFNRHKTIVVHIRRTDYLNYGKRDISLPMEYFQARLNAIPNLDDYKVFFVSDDMPHVKASFPQHPNFIFSSNSEIIDFQLIKNADIAIISNSSFAWWACYLSDKNNTVYAPKNWLGFRIGKEHPKRIMTKRFNWVDVLE